MATSRMSSTSVAISQMPKLPVVPPTAEIPVVASGTNFSVTAKDLVALVTKSSIGLDKVENLSPAEMPISDAAQAALDGKLDKGASIPMDQVTGLEGALQDKLGKNDPIAQSQVTGLEKDLSDKLDKTGSINMNQVIGLSNALDNKLNVDQQIPQSQVSGLEVRLHAIESDPIASSRISDFDPAVQAIIDRQPYADQQVVQGAHQW